MYSRLLARLATSLGTIQAKNELRWMQQAVQRNERPNISGLEEMVARRSRGEPLQYILGVLSIMSSSSVPVLSCLFKEPSHLAL